MGSSLKIKVCGMKDLANLEQVCSLGPDLVGFIFYKGSKRYVGDQPDPSLFAIPANQEVRVGVFVDESLASIKRILDQGWLDMVQLHGNEDPAYCKELQCEGVKIIKALGPESIKDPGLMQGYVSIAHYFLFDTPGEGFGGTGKKFNWEMLDQYDFPLPFFLSGGIGPDDVQSIRELDQPWFHGVDVNSGFEVTPGIKDIGKLQVFINEIRK